MMHQWDPEDYRKSSSAQYSWAMALIEGLRINGDERILDIGCGDGRITSHLASLVSRGRVLGVDISPEMTCSASKEHAHRLNLQF